MEEDAEDRIFDELETTRRSLMKLTALTGAAYVKGGYDLADWTVNLVDQLQGALNSGEWQAGKEFLDGSSVIDYARQNGRSFRKLRSFFYNVAGYYAFDEEGEFEEFQDFCPGDFFLGMPDSRSNSKVVFNENGRLTTWFDGTHQVPFSGHQNEINSERNPAFLPEGVFAGVKSGEEVEWLTEMEVVDSRIEDGVFNQRFEWEDENGDEIGEIEREAFLTPGDHLVQDYTMEFEEGLDGKFLSYSSLMPNSTRQNMIVDEADELRGVVLEGLEGVLFESNESDSRWIAQLEDAQDATLSRPNIGEEEREEIWENLEHEVSDVKIVSPKLMGVPVHPHVLPDPSGAELSEITDMPWAVFKEKFVLPLVEDDKVYEEGKSFEELIENLEANSDHEYTGKYIGAIQSSPIDADEGEKVTKRLVISSELIENIQELPEKEEIENEWKGHRERIDFEEGQNQIVARELLLNTLKFGIELEDSRMNHRAYLAAPHRQPGYARIWPRDSLESAKVMARYGLGHEAEESLLAVTDLLEEAENGKKLRQYYLPNGEYAGIIGEEYDQDAIYIESAYEIEQAVEIDLIGRYNKLREGIKDVAEYLSGKIDDNDLIEPSQDWREEPDDENQSIWTNLKSIKAFYKVTKDDRIDREYSEELETLISGVNEHLLEEDTYYTSLKDEELDGRKSGMESLMFYDDTWEQISEDSSIDNSLDIDEERYIEEMLDYKDFEPENFWTVSTAETLKGLKAVERDYTETVDMLENRIIEYIGDNGAVAERILEGNREDANNLQWAQGTAAEALAMD